ncbi:MAG: hypothetical protein AB8H79_26935 [Myxococcota bacterium]
MIRAFAPTLGLVVALLVFAVTLFRGGALLGADGDLFIHMAYGQALLDAGGVPAQDPVVFTTTVGDALILHEWASEVLFVVLHAAYGLAGPLVLLAVVVAGLPWLAYRRSIAQKHGVWVALLSALLVYFGLASHQLARPHLFTWVLVVALLWVLSRWQSGNWRWWDACAAVFGLGALWANLHGGGLLVAALLIGVHWVGSVLAPTRPVSWWQGAPLLASAALGSLVNPAGWHLHAHVVGFLSHTSENVAADFGPPDLASGTLLTLVVLGVAIAVPTLMRWRHVAWTERILVVVVCAMGATSMRNLPLMGVIAAPMAPGALAGCMRAASGAEGTFASGARLAAEERGRGGWVLALGVVMAGLTWTTLQPPQLSGRAVPTDVATWLNEHPEVKKSRGYAGYDASGYLLHTAALPSVYLHALNANTPWYLMDEHRILERVEPGWSALLDRRKVQWTCALQNSALADALDAHRCWQRSHTDDVWAVHTRNGSCRD